MHESRPEFILEAWTSKGWQVITPGLEYIQYKTIEEANAAVVKLIELFCGEKNDK